MVQIIDSTLREGEQTPGIYFSPDTKLLIAQLLDKIGIDIIEAGNPAVSLEISSSLTTIVNSGLNAKIGAHSLCRIDHVTKALDCGVDFLGIFLSVSQQRLERDYKISLQEAIERIVEVIRYTREQKPDLLIRYTPEDTVRSSMEHVIQAASAAVEAGANIISIADTTGYATPFQPERSYFYYVKTLKQELAKRRMYPKIEVHCHNDRGLALANALDAYKAGADIIDITVMGLGERTGIVDLATLLVNLIDMGEPESRWNLNDLQQLYELVSQHSHISIPPHSPIIGKNAFTHYAGVHVKAIAQDEGFYQSLDTRNLVKKSNVALGMQSGITAIELALKQIGREDLLKNSTLMNQILNDIKEFAKRGIPIDIEREFPTLVEKSLEKCISLEIEERQRADGSRQKAI